MRRRSLLLFAALSACAASARAAERVAPVDPLIPQLMAQSFNAPIYSKPYFNSLCAPARIPFADEIGWTARTPDQLAAIAAKFPLPAALRGQAKLDLRTFVSSQEKAPHMILMGVISKKDGDKTPLGSFSVVLKRAKDEQLESHIAAVYFDRADPRLSGIAPAMLDFLGKRVYPAVDVRKETLKADHAGRYVWAKQGFQFDPTYWFKDVGGAGPAIKLPELARRNFARFLKLHGLSVKDLALRGKPLASLDQLQTPDDFASVKHRRGKTLALQPFVLGALQPAAKLDVGKAFMLADYRPQGGKYVLSMARTKFSTTAMPYWNGWRVNAVPFKPAPARPRRGVFPERTAIARRGPSVPTRLAEPFLAGRILDYGAGRGADSKYLRSKGFEVASYDPHYFPHKPAPEARFDWVLLNYVLNVIASPGERASVLKDVRSRLKPGGRAVIAVRTAADLEEAKGAGWKRSGDGWLTPERTFQHGYAPGRLEAALEEAGLEPIARLDDHAVIVARKGDQAIPFGKHLPQAVYLHRSLEDVLPAKASARVRAAEALLPKDARWNLLKIAEHGASVSFLWYPRFDSDPHPALRRGYRVDDGRVHVMDYSGSENPPILHRKETFVAPGYPGYARFRAETKQEEAAGLLSRPDIGTLRGWRRALKSAE